MQDFGHTKITCYMVENKVVENVLSKQEPLKSRLTIKFYTTIYLTCSKNRQKRLSSYNCYQVVNLP